MTTNKLCSEDLRKGRFSERGRLYLITTCTTNREKHFVDLSNARAVIKAMKYQDNIGNSKTLAFVVMPDHIHWLFSLESGTLSKVVGSVKSWSARSIGKPVWQSNYHDRALRNEESIISVSRYVVANPLRAGLVEHIGDYPHWDAIWMTGKLSL